MAHAAHDLCHGHEKWCRRALGQYVRDHLGSRGIVTALNALHDDAILCDGLTNAMKSHVDVARPFACFVIRSARVLRYRVRV